MRISRPVVRNFKTPFLDEAAAWVRRGGHALAWLGPRQARLVFPRPKKGDEMDLGYWSVLDLGRFDYDLPKSGPFAGFGVLNVPHDCYTIVRDRVTRDSIHPKPRRDIDLDCLECGSCCRDNRVELEPQDVARFEKAGRTELTRAPYAKRDDGKIILVLQRNRDCKHLASDNKCGVYPIRPDACSTFPAGSECCLSAREEELGIVDGAPLEPSTIARRSSARAG